VLQRKAINTPKNKVAKIMLASENLGSCIVLVLSGAKSKTKKAAQPLVGGGLGGILPANLDYRHPKGGSDPEVGSHPAANPLNQGVGFAPSQ
jgi:hypothetical protein